MNLAFGVFVLLFYVVGLIVGHVFQKHYGTTISFVGGFLLGFMGGPLLYFLIDWIVGLRTKK